ncbi:hypothetical protein JTE90_026635 [Oedothorax gibbosus]|uniref:Pre-C2HC domain-containing protein n=1 Tax=Oedothorax gibbosus TaxID=931172 RepID=A0AAV6TK12_9ARAC|nr:hypothetical protein JTE90_026635 [Oedothorax gibbosus]
MHSSMPIWSFVNKSPSAALELLNNPNPAADQKLTREAVIQLVIKTNDYLNTHKNFFRKSDPKTPQASQDYIKWINIHTAAMKNLGSLSTEEHIRVSGHPEITSKSAGAELPCAVVPPGDDPRTPKPRPHQDGISAKELVDKPSHPDSPAPSIDAYNYYSLPSTSSAMEITDDPDGNGSFIKDTRKPIKRKTRDTISPSIVHPNKFQHLNPDVSLDEINPTEENEDNFSQVNNRSTRIPPLIITNPQFKWTEIRKRLIDSLGEERFSGKTSGEHFKLQMSTEKGHRIASKLLEDLNIDYSTYAFKGQNPLKVIIKNLPADTDPAEIIQALKAEDLPIQNVHQLKKTIDFQRIPLPIFLAELERNSIAKNIFNLTEILHIKVNIESYQKGNNITQCHRCQRFGHGQRHCHNAPRCVKCADNHLTSSHNGRAETPKCANCGGPHVASYRLCPSRPQSKDASQGSARPNIAAPPAPPTLDLENYPQFSTAPPPPPTPTWTSAEGHRQNPATSHQAPPAGAPPPPPPSSAPPPSTNPGPRSNSSSDNHNSFDLRTLFFKLHNLWQKFKTSKDIITKMEIGFEAITELFNLFSHE